MGLFVRSRNVVRAVSVSGTRSAIARPSVGRIVGGFAGVFSGPAFAQLEDAKQLSHMAKPLPEYGSGVSPAVFPRFDSMFLIR